MAGIARGQLWSQDAMLSGQKVEFLRKWNFLEAWNLGLPSEPARTGHQRLQVSPWLELYVLESGGISNPIRITKGSASNQHMQIGHRLSGTPFF